MRRFAMIAVVAAALALTAGSRGKPLDVRSADFTVEWVCKAHGDRVRELFGSLDLSRAGMERVRAAVEDERWEDACRELLSYYRGCDSGAWLRLGVAPSWAGKKDARSEKLLQDTFTYHSLEYKVPRTSSGGLNWKTGGPNNDREWTQAFNRLYHLPWLMYGYLNTGDEAYARRIAADMVDWIFSNPYPGRPARNPQWAGLAVAARVRFWAEVFYGLQASGALAPGASILMLSSLTEHVRYLQSFHHERGNWVAAEMSGLATAAAAWPEFKESNAWLSYAIGVMKAAAEDQVYPDGAQKELTAQYEYVAAFDFELFVSIIAHAGAPAPAEIESRIEQMWGYLAYTMRPDGYSPMNNDSDHYYARRNVLPAAERYHRPDWTYIATNGREGTLPERGPSVAFPWAGQLVTRDGWGEDAQWAFFDAGPSGIAHMHADKLHLSVSAYGRDLLVDAGRYTYAWGVERNYFVGSASHNVILVDGCRQELSELEATRPLAAGEYGTDETFDFMRGTIDTGYIGLKGTATHTRTVVYARGAFWVVVDHISTDRPRDLQALWHFHPDCTIETDGDTVASVDDGKGNLRVVPVAAIGWGVDVVSGRMEPDMQGWYSDAYNHKVPNPTAVYRARIDGPVTFAWVLVPSRGRGGKVDVAVETLGADTVAVRVGDTDVTVPVIEGRPRVTQAAGGSIIPERQPQ